MELKNASASLPLEMHSKNFVQLAPSKKNGGKNYAIGPSNKMAAKNLCNWPQQQNGGKNYAIGPSNKMAAKIYAIGPSNKMAAKIYAIGPSNKMAKSVSIGGH
jgi:hypothetical protein